MSEAHTAFAERLIQALKLEGKPTTPAQLARAFTLEHWGDGITLHGARKWLRGEALPTEDKLRTLAHWLNVDPHELRYGVSPNKALAEQLKQLPYAAQNDVAAVEQFLALPPEHRKTVRAVIKAFALTGMPA